MSEALLRDGLERRCEILRALLRDAQAVEERSALDVRGFCQLARQRSLRLGEWPALPERPAAMSLELTALVQEAERLQLAVRESDRRVLARARSLCVDLRRHLRRASPSQPVSTLRVTA